jgi:hypothetical protein
MKRPILAGLAGVAAVFVILGCTKSGPETTNVPDPKASAEAAKYLLAGEPAGAKGVKGVKQASKDGDDVVVVGRIGGSKKPFTGRAAFTIVDLGFVSCNEMEGWKDYPTPWEFC